MASPITDFAYKKKLKFDTATIDVTTNQPNFPICVHINTSSWPTESERDNFFGVYNVNGKRIQFFDSNGTTNLDYEVELYASGTPEAIYWVRVPQVDGDSNADYIWVAFGSDPNGVNQDNPVDVWDPNFLGVYHMNRLDWNAYKVADGVLIPDATYGYCYIEPSVIYDEELFKMWAKHGPQPSGTEGSGIGYYTATDGVTFTEVTSVVADKTYMHHQVYKPVNGRTPLEGAVADDGGSTTDETTVANNATANDMTLLPATPAVNDAYYFGGPYRFNSLLVNVGIAGVGSWTITWEYYNGAWVALSGVTDNTNGFTTSGEQKISYTLPADWAEVAVKGITSYWLRVRVSAYISIVTQPKGTQAWVKYDYWMYANDWVTDGGATIDLLVSRDGTDFQLDRATVIGLGTHPAWDDIMLGNVYVWEEGANWFMLYDALGELPAGNWKFGWATSSDGRTWVKDGQNPIEFSTFIHDTDLVGSAEAIKIDSTYYLLLHGNDLGAGSAASDGYLGKATNLDTVSNVCGAATTLIKRTLAWENPAGSLSQVADLCWVEHDNKTYIYYSGMYDQTPAVGEDWRIGGVVLPMTIAEAIRSAIVSDSSTTLENAIMGYFESDTKRPTVTSSGKVGSAESFDGSDDYISLGDNFDPGIGDWTAEFWFTAAASKGSQHLFTKRSDDAPNYIRPFDIRVEAYNHATQPGKLSYTTRYGAEIDAIYGVAAVNDAAWHYSACVRDGDTGKLLYLDTAAAVTSAGNVNDDLANTQAAIFGASNAYNEPLSGKVDELRISNVVRSADWKTLTYYSMLKTNFNGDSWLSWDAAVGLTGIKAISDLMIANVQSMNNLAMALIKTINDTA